MGKERRVRAFRASDPEREVCRRMAALALFMRGDDLRRALRDSRKSARAGAAGYDPARHAALLRLLKAEARGPRPGHRPSNSAVER